MPICPECEATFAEGTTACVFDGKALVDGPVCPSCRLEHLPGTKQCRICGAALQPPKPRATAVGSSSEADGREGSDAGGERGVLPRPPTGGSRLPRPSVGTPQQPRSAVAAGPPTGGPPLSAPPSAPPAASPSGTAQAVPASATPAPGAVAGGPPGAAMPVAQLVAVSDGSIRELMPDKPVAVGFGSRAVAFLIDQTLIGIPTVIGWFVTAGAMMAAEEGDVHPVIPQIVMLGVYGGWAFFGFLDFVLLQGLKGASVGKMLMGMRVVREDGSELGMGWAFLRWLCYSTISSWLCNLGFWWALWDSEGQTWHDKICRTYVTFA